MKHSTKRLLSLLLSLAMVLAMLPAAVFAQTPSTLYLQPNENWIKDGARFAAVLATQGWSAQVWVGATDADGDGVYEIAVPDDGNAYSIVIFCRMNPNASENNWNNKWNQTADLNIPTDGSNCYVVAPNTWDKGNGQWISFTPGGEIVTEPTEPAPLMYTVAGSEGLCGSSWTPEDTNNMMSDEDGDGIYTITYKNVAAGTYEFKVTKGNWGECWPGENYILTLDAESDVTINFNTADSGIFVDVVAKGEPVVTEPVVTEPVTANYYVAGSFNGWTNPDAAYQMAAQADGTYALTFAVTAGDYEFKVTAGNWEECWPGENYVFTAVADGDLTITFNPADSAIAISGDCLGNEEPTEPSVPADVVYFVAGVEALCGSGWDPADTNNKMSDEDGDGIYTITYTDVAAGEYEFKVTNGSWEMAWPGENYMLTVTETMDITIAFNSSDNSINVILGIEPSEPVEMTYIVAGQAELCGNGWDPADINNKMFDEDGDGIYTITYTNVAAGDYMFKVTDGTWNNCWGGDGTDGNYVFRLYALSNVTIGFDPATGIISLNIEELEAPTEPSVPEVTETVYYLAGTFNGWNTPDAAYAMNAEVNGIYSLTVAVTAGDHEFKVTDGSWTNCWPVDNYTFKAYNDGEVTVSFNASDYSINITGECLNEPAPDPMTITSMHVAGSAGLCGAEWDPAANQMDCAMGVYTITFSDVAAGTYEFKFVANGTWELNWASGIEMPSGETQTAWFNAQGNSSVVVAEDGSTVTLTFDMTTMDIITGEGATTSVLVEAPAAPEVPAASFQVGDQIIIYALESDVAMSTTQNKNNRGVAEIVKSEGTISFGEDTQVITLVEGTVAGSFGFQVGEGQYLYAASSKSNYLKTTDTLDDNASWNIVIDEITGEATITACGENTRNLLRYNKSSSLFSCYASGQEAVAVYKITGSEPEMPEPKDLELELGDNALILDAGDRDGDTWTFIATEAGTLSLNFTAASVDNGMGELEEVPAEYLSMVLPRNFGVLVNGTAVYEYPVELAVAVGDEIIVSVVSSTFAPAELTLNLELLPPVVEEPETQTATLVTDLSTLQAGDLIIIVAQDYDMALSVTQNSNNRGQAEIVKNGNTVTFTDEVQIITLEGDEEGFYFNVGNGYLYAASSSKNYLKTQTEADENAMWDISVDENGELSIVGCGEFTRNNLRYNSSSGLFSCYASGQQPVCFYKLGAEEGTDSNELVLGDNALVLEAGDVDGDTWTYTATEDGTVYLDIAAMTVDNMGIMEAVPTEYLSMVFGRQYTLLVNGMPFDVYNEQYAVIAGEVVSIQIFSNTAKATELTLNLVLGEPVIIEPAEPGTSENPLPIEAMPFEVTFGEYHDIYYTYVAEKDGTLVIAAPEGNLVSGLTDYEKIGNTYYMPVVAGDVVTINPWGDVPGTYTMAYGDMPSEVVQPTIALKYPTLTFKDEVLANIYYAVDNMESVVEMGMITYASQVDSWNINNAEDVISGYNYYAKDNLYIATTRGIPAKNLGDDIWFSIYAKLTDGSYVYSMLASYSPKMYADSMWGYDAKLDSLLVSMLNYGAAAQTYFGYNTDKLVNRDLTEDQKAMVSEYSSDMIAQLPDTIPAEKQGAFANNNGFTNKYPSVSFKGAFAINYYCKATATPVEDVTLYYWDEAAYAANEVLTAENATGTVEMTLNGNGEYTASVKGIAARKVNSVVYVAFSYSDGNTDLNSGVMAYSIGEYCRYYASVNHAFTPMAKVTAVYGFYAKGYFG